MQPTGRALTIAGSDNSGGAGIQADLKTFTAFGVYGMSAITAVTAQNTRGVLGFEAVSLELIAAQIDSVVEDIGVDAAKTGMLASAPIVRLVADKVRELRIPNLVVDPVMMAKSGHALLAPEAQEAVRTALLPVALVATPNTPEAEALTGRRIETTDDMRAAARDLYGMGVKWVVVKGGHLPAGRLGEPKGFPERGSRGRRPRPPSAGIPTMGINGSPQTSEETPAGAEGGDLRTNGEPHGFPNSEDAVDIVFDGREFVELRGPRYPTKNTHGTGCTFSAAIVAGLAKGRDPLAAITRAKQYISRAIETSLSIGHGHGPTNHLVDVTTDW
jgi:hydroxymethylpyrimidine/phosphomethylpyrimidine kinase